MARRRLRLVAEGQTGWRNGANHGGIPTRSLAFLFESFCVRDAHSPPAPCVARIPHFCGRSPAAKYIDIDAFNGRTVTRQTLLRYRVNCLRVNVIIRADSWKNTGPGAPASAWERPDKGLPSGGQAAHQLLLARKQVTQPRASRIGLDAALHFGQFSLRLAML